MKMNTRKQLKTLFLIGVLIVLLPITGFPGSWKTFFDVVFGVAVAAFAYCMHRALPPASAEKQAAARPFVENSGEGAGADSASRQG